MRPHKPSKKDSQWKLEIHQLDVGQGDSALILFKKLNPATKKHEVEKSILIDGGLGHSAGYLNEFLTKKLGANQNLSAVIITHYDGDHYMGIVQNMFMVVGKQGGKGISKILREKSNPHFTKATKFILPTAADENAKLVHGEILKYYGDFDYSVGSYRNIGHNFNFVGRSIWEVFEGKPEGAPDLKIVAADNAYSPSPRKTAKDDNQRSTVSIIGMNNFHFYTAGDFEDNNPLLGYLAAQPNSHDFLPIQAFLNPHHGSKNNIPNSTGARAALISAGKGSGNYDHPDVESLRSIHNNGVAFAYSTNRSGSLKNNQIGKKFVIAGQNNVVTAADTNKFPRGTIRVQTYQNIADVGMEKFMVKYELLGSKTRDYFKDKNFDILRTELAAIGVLQNQTLQLSQRDLRHFLDEGNGLGQQKKIKHLNPKTIRNFAASYKPTDGSNRNYSLNISGSNDEISFEIASNSWQQNGSHITRPFPEKWQAEALVDRVRNLSILGNRVGINLAYEEAQSFLNGSNLTHFVERRETDRMTGGHYFLEVMDPDANKQISTQLWNYQYRPILRKEYHRDQQKLVARRLEYGDKDYRALEIADEEDVKVVKFKPLSPEVQSQIDRIKNYEGDYADDELGAIFKSHLPANSEYISPAVALVPEQLDQAIASFRGHLTKTQMVIAIQAGNHFVGIHIRKEADQFLITYFDPTVDEDYKRPLHDVSVTVAGSLGRNFPDVRISSVSSSIQTYTELTDDAIMADNNHCGAFVACVLTELAKGNARINPDGKIQVKFSEVRWVNIDDLTQAQSNNLGARIRGYHAEFLSGADVGARGQFDVLKDFIFEIKKSEIELEDWCDETLKDPPQQFSKEHYDSLSEMVKRSEFQLTAEQKTKISQAVVAVMRNGKDRDFGNAADEFFANLSEKNLLDHNHVRNDSPLVYRASHAEYKKSFAAICKKCSDATLEYVHASNSSTSLILSVRNGWLEESKIAIARMTPETINQKYQTTSDNNKTALAFVLEGRFSPAQKKELGQILISMGAEIDDKIKENSFYKENFLKSPNASVGNVVADGLLNYARDVHLR